MVTPTKRMKYFHNQTVDTIESSDHVQMRNTFNVMEKMRTERVLCDVILSVGNVEVSAHKTVLAASSSYFYDKLALSNKEKMKCRITLPSTINPEALNILVNYMYCFKIQITEENVKYLLPAALTFKLKTVVDDCCKVLQNQLTPKNCLRFNLIAAECACSEISNTRKKIQYYINEHFSEIVDTEQFRTLQFQQLSLLISRDTLMGPAEEKRYEAVMSWVKYDLKARKQYLSMLMHYVRLPSIPIRYVIEHIAHEPLLKEDPKYTDFIIKEFQRRLLEENEIDAGVDEAISEAILQPSINNLKTANRSDSMVLAVIGGYSEKRNILKTMEYFDFETGRCSKVTEVPHQVLGGAITIDDKIFTLGENNSTSAIFAYNIITNQWFTVNQNLTDNPLISRWGSSGFFIANDCIFVAGERSVAKFNVSNRSWSTFPFQSLSRVGCCTAVMGNKIFVIGGRNHNPIDVYNADLKCWNTLPFQISKYDMGIGIINQTIYIIGGSCIGISNRLCNSVTAFDTATNCLKPIASLNVPRASPGVVTFNNLLYVIGGFNRGCSLSSIEVYDPKTNKWTLLPASMSIGRNFPAVTLVNKSVLRNVSYKD